MSSDVVNGSSAGRIGTVQLVDGTYELYRQFFGARSSHPHAATHGVLRSTLSLFERGSSHVGVATDHVIESFRNAMWAGYKTGEGIEPELFAQIHLIETALDLMGVQVWAMVELEADDALATAAHVAAQDSRVDQVVILTPDKDLGQCVTGNRVVQYDRRNDVTIDEAGVVAKFGVSPASIPDYLALVGDSADGFPGLLGWGAKSASTVLARYGHLEAIPRSAAELDVKIRGAEALISTLDSNFENALLFRQLATLRIDTSVVSSVDQIAWREPTSEFKAWCNDEGIAEFYERVMTVWQRNSRA